MTQLTFDMNKDAASILFGIKEGEIIEGVSLFNNKFLIPIGIYWWYTANGYDVVMTALCSEFVGIFNPEGVECKVPHIRTEEQYFQQSLIFDLPYTLETALVLSEIADNLHLVLNKDYP